MLGKNQSNAHPSADHFPEARPSCSPNASQITVFSSAPAGIRHVHSPVGTSSLFSHLSSVWYIPSHECAGSPRWLLELATRVCSVLCPLLSCALCLLWSPGSTAVFNSEGSAPCLYTRTAVGLEMLKTVSRSRQTCTTPFPVFHRPLHS